MTALAGASLAAPVGASASTVPEARAVGVTLAGVTGPETSASVSFEIWPDSRVQSLTTSFDIRVSHTSMLRSTMARWTYPAGLKHRDLGSRLSLHVKVPLSRGQIVCAASRPRFADGAVGLWGQKYCKGRLLDDSSLVRHGKTRRVADKRYWGGHASEVFGRGSLTLRHVQKGSVIVVMTTDPASAGACPCVWLDYPTAKGTGQLGFGSEMSRTTGYRLIHHMAVATGRYGTLVFRSADASWWSNPVEGILVLPPWSIQVPVIPS